MNSALDTRDRMIDSAISVFAEKGYAATTVSDVARAAGLTTGSVYSNFEGKHDLFLECVRRFTGGMPHFEETVEGFTEAALDYLRMMRERPDLHRLKLWAEMQEATDPEVHAILERSRGPLVEVMLRLFHREGGALIMAVLRGFSGVASEMIHPAVVEQVVRSVIRATVELNVAMDAGQSTALIGVDPPVDVEHMPAAAPY